MAFDFNVYALTLVFLGSITLLLSLYILSNETGAVRWVGLLMLSNSIWSITYGLELASSVLLQMKLLINIEYLGVVSLPFNWFLFCLVLAGKEKWLKKNSNKVLITIVPLFTLLLLWTNSFHHLYYKNLSIDSSGSFPMLKIEPGIAYYLFTFYFYTLLAIGNYLLIKKFSKSDAVYRKQNRAVLAGALIPWIANFAYMLGLRPMNNLDMTPYAFMIANTMIFIAIYRFELFDTLPVAREKVLELMRDAFVVLDHQNRIIDYNSAFKKYTCASQSGELIGKAFTEILPDQHNLVLFLEKHESGKTELMVQTSEGLFDLEVDITFLNENKLNRNATIIKFQDLTNLRQQALKSQQQAEELQKLNQLKDRVFSIMAHDLRGPLLNVTEVLKMMSDDMISPEEFKFLSPKLTKDISYTADLLENILHWSRSQLKGYSINRDYCDMKALVSSEISYHMKSATDKDITITHSLQDDLTAFADLLMMQMVVRNLLSNAIKFCHSHCFIDVSAACLDHNFISICIQDTGVGIAEENIKRIFSGENVSSRGTKNEKGTGIGLMVCWDFMERNGGNITMESEVGKGTRFDLKIPRAAL
ncbi:PAS/PAC sensor signal transduction histidine kinase [Pedobacter westerhofensis]|uniref:histidine kinase n=1 Tax=Pedobacter westerhofensis TaxID=425512 RepID=A0A521FQU6_9SPHI|nr:histidine kinase N-terminal 7TM domain-containing protein [Pedobacter westerhofensis]SMO97910.1 PAS/PAC sensor signal transduction histidine kinase [Pedobacter westerhofensis]